MWRYAGAGLPSATSSSSYNRRRDQPLTAETIFLFSDTKTRGERWREGGRTAESRGSPKRENIYKLLSSLGTDRDGKLLVVIVVSGWCRGKVPLVCTLETRTSNTTATSSSSSSTADASRALPIYREPRAPQIFSFLPLFLRSLIAGIGSQYHTYWLARAKSLLQVFYTPARVRRYVYTINSIAHHRRDTLSQLAIHWIVQLIDGIHWLFNVLAMNRCCK